MAISTSEILGIMRAYGIVPEESLRAVDLPAAQDTELPEIGDRPEREFPEIGEIEEGETVYSTSLSEVFREVEGPGAETFETDQPRIQEWRDEIEANIRADRDEQTIRAIRALRRPRSEPPEPHCAWYCPIHFFGYGWGIYIREQCILSIAKELSSFVDWKAVHASLPSILRQLLRSAFYVLFLHEQFHHKMESLGYRFLISTGSDHYRPYKARVYRRTYLSADCLEESLANADSYRRLNEPRYKGRVEDAIRDGLRFFLKESFHSQPPGYKESLYYLGEPAYRSALYKLQSQALEGVVSPTKTPPAHWSAAPSMITALTDITDEIYVVLPIGARPIFRITSIDPGYTASSREIESALTKHYGYVRVPGGKGSHVKLAKPQAETITLPGNRACVSPGVIKQILNIVGGLPLSKLKDFLNGNLSAVS
jgi:predicted RNA binding protein YcfA (HicA-like mRNA interferase family)